MKETKISDLKVGDVFTATIEGVLVEGKIQINKGMLYLCQNKKSGNITPDRLGYNYSWVASAGGTVINDAVIAHFEVRNLVIGTAPSTPPVTSITYIQSVKFADITNKTPFTGTYRGKEIKGIFYTSRKDRILYILSNESTARGAKGTYTYGYNYSVGLHVNADGSVYFPEKWKLFFTSKGPVKTITVNSNSFQATIDPKKIATGTPYTAKFMGQDISGIIYSNNQRLFFLCNDGPACTRTNVKLGYKYSYALREASSTTGLIDTKCSYYEILTMGEPTAEMKRLWEIEASIPKESHPGGYAIQRQGNKYIFGCGEVELTYEELVTYVKVRRSIQRKIDRTYHDKIEVTAAALADPKVKEVIEKIK